MFSRRGTAAWYAERADRARSGRMRVSLPSMVWVDPLSIVDAILRHHPPNPPPQQERLFKCRPLL